MLGASRDRTTAVGEPTEFRSLTDRKSSPPDFSAGIIRDWFRPLRLTPESASLRVAELGIAGDCTAPCSRPGGTYLVHGGRSRRLDENDEGPGTYVSGPSRWWRGQDLNLRPSGYEPDELPNCSTPRRRVSLTYASARAMTTVGMNVTQGQRAEAIPTATASTRSTTRRPQHLADSAAV